MTVKPAAILWDMDGTLVDSEGEWMIAASELLEHFGRPFGDEDRHLLIGASMDTAAAVLRRAGVDLSEHEVITALMGRATELVSLGAVWRPGAVELVSEIAAAGIPLALVTMSYQSMADDVVSQLDGDPFSVVIAGDFGGAGKPSPEPYLAAAKALGVDPSFCVALEDSSTGVTSAVAAGMATIAVPLYAPVDVMGIAGEWSTLVGSTLTDVVEAYSRFRQDHTLVNELEQQ